MEPQKSKLFQFNRTTPSASSGFGEAAPEVPKDFV
jgi:hypothetical protein